MDRLVNYVVVNAADNILREERCYSKWDVTIQSGCALTEKRIAALSDDSGENISRLNPVYSELTALYWVWKHKRSSYVGWSHYRRMLDIGTDELEAFMQEGIDVIMPAPMLFEQSVKEQYSSSHALDAWEAMMEVLRNRQPEYYEAACEVFAQNMLFPYCMGIYTYAYFDSYLSWLFPILEEVYSVIGEKWDVYQNRYIAFLAERLHALYFIFHCDTLNYRIVPCKIFSSDDVAETVCNTVTDEQVFQKVQALLYSRQVRKAKLYLISVLKSGNGFCSNEMAVVYQMIRVLDRENIFTEKIMCRRTQELDALVEHYGTLVKYLTCIQQNKSEGKRNSEELEREFWQYLVQTETSDFAVASIIEQDMGNDAGLLEEMAELYCKNERAFCFR